MQKKSLDRSLSQDEDIVRGNNEWLNIQEIVRITFKQLSESIQIQERTIQGLEKQLSLKASKNEVQTLLGNKLDSEEFHIEINNLRSLVQSIRTDTSDLICANREDYVNDYRKIIGELENKANKVDVKNSLVELEYQRNIMNGEVKEIRKDFDGKLQSLKNQIAVDIDYTREIAITEIDKLIENNKQVLGKIAKNKSLADESAQDLHTKLKSLEDTLDINTQLHAKSEDELSKKFNSNINTVQNGILEEINAITENFTQLCRDFEQVKALKADNSQVMTLIQMRSDEINLLREELNFQSQQLKARLPYSEFDKELKLFKDAMELVKREISVKYDRKILEIHELLDSRVSKDDYASSIRGVKTERPNTEPYFFKKS
ncbi:hypothetical protein SteCoe_7704 [Stentor coeruleus]|uniref:Uncharacterized protein n=1 Tax=Stentor coeruleus TaxID=5963 RepID=A0A1R2CM26_9CILI|nr:hypothetical protein SteCoe_7704 [Stentor coeruleus]